MRGIGGEESGTKQLPEESAVFSGSSKRVGSMSNLKESQVVKMWQQLGNNVPLVTESGEPLVVIYPGRINDDRGADFRDAVVATSNGVQKGDIEVHVKSSDWRAHGHHHDPVYNRVILHVVMWHDRQVVPNQGGEAVPVLALDKYMVSRSSQYPVEDMPCRRTVGYLSDSVMPQFLDAAGEERFLAKTAEFNADLAQMEASQCLYRGMMVALGYSKNKAPFRELARRLPLRLLESVAHGEATDEECLARQQALLLGTAGLLPSQRPVRHQEANPDDIWVDRLERLWASFSPTEVMSHHDWNLFKVRPNNSPTRRIAAMSYLVVRYRERGMFDGVVDMVRKSLANKKRLEQGLVVTADGYWASHFDFGPGRRLESPTLLGGHRAADIVVNVLLPLASAWGKLAGQPELENNAVDLYHCYPRLVENSVERHMRNQLGLSRSLVNSAQRQQGLIHIYSSLCAQGKCHRCPLKSWPQPGPGQDDIASSK